MYYQKSDSPMDPSNESCNTLLTCGSVTMNPTFNDQTKIKDIRKYVCQTFHTSLPNTYQIVYYDPTKMLFVNLEDQLRNGFNPFQLNSSIGVQSTTSSTADIHLYVVSNIHSQTEIQDDQIVSDGVDDEIRPESNLSVNSISTNENVSQDSSTSDEDRLLTLIPHSIEPQRADNNRLFFSLDVKPSQRNIYKSDQFSIRTGKTTGRIARVQGRKTSEQKMLQVLPRLRIPSTCFQPNVTLLVAVVSEEINNGMRIWYKHLHKGFLPDGYEKDTQSINPITFDLDKCTLTEDGDFILSVQMITKWDKSKKEREEFYRFDDKETTLLHPAKHEEDLPRLFCVLQRNNVIDWNTFCLSDFIRSTKHSKKRSASATTERTDSPDRKRIKVND